MIFRFAEPRPSRPLRPEDPDPAAPAPEAPIDQRATAGEEVNTVVTALMPWVISTLLHLGLVVIAFFAIWSTYDTVDEDEIIVPMVELSDTPTPPLQMRTEERVRERADQRQIVQDPAEDIESELDLDAEADVGADLVGVAGAAGAGDSPFGTAVADGAEFRTQFMGVSGGNARQVVFVIDASGELIDTFHFVLNELAKTINRLSERQRFTVIFFRDNDVIEAPPRGRLKPADAENKQAVISWMQNEVEAWGMQTPVPAIEAALRYRPDVVFLLSTNILGRGPYATDRHRLLQEIRRTNTAGTHISTIQFIYRDPLEQIGVKSTMQEIAEQSGGTHQFVDGEMLGLIARRQR